MASKRIDELTTRTVVNTDLLPPTPSGGPSGSATVAAVVKAGLSQPNSASAGAGANVTIKAADGVTSGAGGNIILQPGSQATTGGDGAIIIASPAGNADFRIIRNSSTEMQLTFPSGSKFTVKRSDIGRRIELNPEGGISYSAGIIMTGPFPCINVVEDFATSAVNSNFYFCSNGGFGGEFGFGLSGQSNTGCTLIKNQAGTSGGTLAAKAATTNISSNQNDLSLGTSMFCRLNCTVASNVTGIAWPAGVNGSHTDGRMIRVVNVGTATLTLKHNSTSSSAANRMFCASGADYALSTNAWAELVYDSTDNGSGAAGWRVYQ